VNKHVYFEETQDVTAAIEREKEIKKWRREKKNQLVNRNLSMKMRHLHKEFSVVMEH
jgi:putative endonuclease